MIKIGFTSMLAFTKFQFTMLNWMSLFALRATIEVLSFLKILLMVLLCRKEQKYVIGTTEKKIRSCIFRKSAYKSLCMFFSLTRLQYRLTVFQRHVTKQLGSFLLKQVHWLCSKLFHSADCKSIIKLDRKGSGCVHTLFDLANCKPMNVKAGKKTDLHYCTKKPLRIALKGPQFKPSNALH